MKINKNTYKHSKEQKNPVNKRWSILFPVQLFDLPVQQQQLQRIIKQQ